jgi:glyoxylase I family protein
MNINDLKAVHHIAIICSNYETSKEFYTDVLGLTIIQEVYREERRSFKLDLALNDQYIIELFSFPDPPKRSSGPESCGLRHLAFSVSDIEKSIQTLTDKGVTTEPIRIDEFTGKRFTFFNDPDGLPLELYEG